MEIPKLTIRIKGKKWRVPEVVKFEGGLQMYYYRPVDFRPPKRGEFYLSGAIPEAYRAPNDLSGDSFVIVEKTFKAKMVQAYTKGEEIE